MIYGTTGFSMVEIWRKKHIDLSNSWRKERSEVGSNMGRFYLMILLFLLFSQGHSNPEIQGGSAESTNENGNFGRHGGRRRLLRFRGRWRGPGRVQVSVHVLLLIIIMDVTIYSEKETRVHNSWTSFVSNSILIAVFN